MEKNKFISHEELEEKLKTYSSITSQEKHDFVFERLHKKYKDQSQKTMDNNITSSIYYAQGQRSGIPQTPFEELQLDQERTKQKQRTFIANEAKQAYDSKENLRSEFKSGKSDTDALSQKYNLKSRPLKIKR